MKLEIDIPDGSETAHQLEYLTERAELGDGNEAAAEDVAEAAIKEWVLDNYIQTLQSSQ